MSQHARVGGIEGRSAHEVIHCLPMPAGSFEKTGCVKCEFERMRVEIASLPAVEDGAIKLSCRGKRAARVTVSGSPLGPYHQKSFVCCCRLFVSPAIAENPGTQIRDFFFLGLQVESDAGALDCIVAASLVVQSLAQLAIEPGSFMVGNVAALEMKAACVEVAEKGRAYRRLTNLTNVAQLRAALEVRAELDKASIVGCGTKRDRSGRRPLQITSLHRNAAACVSGPPVIRLCVVTNDAPKFGKIKSKIRLKSVKRRTLLELAATWLIIQPEMTEIKIKFYH